MFRNLTKKQLTALLVSLAVVIIAGVGITLAFVIDSTKPVENEFTPSHVSCAVVENDTAYESDQVSVSEKKDVKIRNTGDTDAFIRAAIVVTWKKADGTVYAQKPVLGTDYELAIGDRWACSASDGYYYYAQEVAPGDLTPALITSCTQNANAPVDDYYLSVEIVASAVQSTPDGAVYTAWGATAQNGTIIAIPGGTVTTN